MNSAQFSPQTLSLLRRQELNINFQTQWQMLLWCSVYSNRIKAFKNRITSAYSNRIKAFEGKIILVFFFHSGEQILILTFRKVPCGSYINMQQCLNILIFVLTQNFLKLIKIFFVHLWNLYGIHCNIIYGECEKEYLLLLISSTSYVPINNIFKKQQK